MPTSDGEKVSSVSSIRHAGQQDVNFTCLGSTEGDDSDELFVEAVWDEGPAREKKILR